MRLGHAARGYCEADAMFEVRHEEVSFARVSAAEAARLHLAAEIVEARSARSALRLRVPKAADQSRGTLRVSVERGEKFISRHPRLQCLRLQIGGDERKRIVVPIPGRGARPGARVEIAGALAAEEFVGGFTRFALRQSGHRHRDAVRDPMDHAETAAALRINQGERKALRPGRRILPLERRRDVLSDAIGVGLVVAGILYREFAVVLKAWRGQGEVIGDGRYGDTQAEQGDDDIQEMANDCFHVVNPRFVDPTPLDATQLIWSRVRGAIELQVPAASIKTFK